MFDKEYVFYGKHADTVKRLTAPLSSDIKKKLFDTNYDVYAIAPIIGYLYNKKALPDKSSDSNTKVFRDKMMDESENLKYNYRLIMLLTYKDSDQEELKKIAFKMDNDDAARAEYDRLYDQYVLGGVEVLEDKVFSGADDIDGYIMNVYNFMDEFNNRYYAVLNDSEQNGAVF